MKHLLILTMLFLCVACYEQDESQKSSQDQCLKSEKLSFILGEKTIVLQRKDVLLVQGDNVPNVSLNEGVQGLDVCQKKKEVPIRVNSVYLSVKPMSCNGEKNCLGKKIKVRLKAPMNNYIESDYTLNFTERCTVVSNPKNEWEKNYGRLCRLTFQDNSFLYWIQFYNGVQAYPPSKIDETKRIVINEIDKVIVKN